jgi:peptidyl-tRNA hydrolase, PTH2 family
MMSVMKQVIVINDSLKLPRGKLAAQVAHASVASFLSANSTSQQEWLDIGMPKVVLSACSADEVIDYHQKALAANLPAFLIKDAGKTVIAPGTITCLGIGPAPEREVDQITAHLKLA